MADISQFCFFFFKEVFLFPSHLKDSFTGYKILRWWLSSFNTFKYFILFISQLYGFWWETSAISYSCSSYSSCHCLHSVFPFYLVFYSLNMIMPLHRVFRIYPAWFVWASWICSLVFVLNFGKFLVIITSNVSYAPYTLSSPSIITFRHIAFVISFDILFL